MFSFFDKDFTYAGDTVLLHTGYEPVAVVPSAVASHPIRRIGSGAFSNKNTLEQIYFQEGIEEIKSCAIAFLPRLQFLSLPSTIRAIDSGNKTGQTIKEISIAQKVNPDTLKLLKAGAAQTDGGRFLMRPSGIPKRVLDLLDALGIFLSELPENHPLVLSAETTEDTPEEGDPVPCVWNFSGEKNLKTEQEVVRYLMQCENVFRHSPKEENSADAQYRMRSVHASSKFAQKEAVAHFTDQDHRWSEGQEILTIHITRSFFFAPRITPVDMQGRRFYVYSREYRNKSAAGIYDIAVLREDGSVAKQKEAEAAYAKYRLPALL